MSPAEGFERATIMNSGLPIAAGFSFDDVLLVPQRTRASSRRAVDVGTQLTRGIRLRVPVISANTPWCTERAMAIAMASLGGIGIVHRMALPEDQVGHVRAVKAAAVDPGNSADATVDPQGRLRVGAAVGVTAGYLQRAALLADAGADLLLVDVAHGHADSVIEAVAALKQAFPRLDILAGNVATAAAVEDLVAAGADGVKVGIGPGSVCTTRTVAGAGVPQLTAILDCAHAARRRDVPLIADGGIRTSGDIAKALAAGASSIMLGKLLAGTDESSALPVEHDGRRYKVTTGFVTLGAGLTIQRLATGAVDAEAFRRYLPEGIEATFEGTGPAAGVVARLIAGLRSGMSYSGSMTIAELWDRAKFIAVSRAGQEEGKPHAQDGVPKAHPDYERLFLAAASGS